MTSIDLRKTSLLAVTALSSVTALALYTPANAEPMVSWRVAQGAPQPALTDEEKQRLEAVKRRRDGGGTPGQPPAPNAPTAAPVPPAPPPGAKIQATPPDAPKVMPRLVNPSTPPPAAVPKTAPPAVTTPVAPPPNAGPNAGPADAGRSGDRATRAREFRRTDPATASPAPAPVTPAAPPPAPVAKPVAPPATTSPATSPATAPAVTTSPTPPPVAPPTVTPKVETPPAPDGRRSDRNRPDRPDRQPATPPSTATGTAAGVAAGGAAAVVAPAPVTAPPAGPAPKNLDDAKSGRTERTVEGNRTVIQETDRRTITRQGDRVVIQKDEAAQLQRVAPGATITRDTAGTNTAVVERPGNVKIITETDKSGQLVRRFRRDGDGRETAIIDNRQRKKNNFGRNLAIGVGVGAGIIAGAAILNSVVDVPPPVVRVPRDKYVVRYEDASEDDVYEALSAPPVDRVDRPYTLDEVRATHRLRERMRRVDLDDINFEFGSWDVNPSEYRKLERIARAMNRVIERNPNEVFLIEGYTDAVGSDVDNLTLSDRRAETVSVILSEQFRVPFENLTTQGYGEEYLKVETDGPERANRRVAVRRITPLISKQVEVAPPPPPRRRYDDRRYNDDDRPYRRWRRHNRYRDDY